MILGDCGRLFIERLPERVTLYEQESLDIHNPGGFGNQISDVEHQIGSESNLQTEMAIGKVRIAPGERFMLESILDRVGRLEEIAKDLPPH